MGGFKSSIKFLIPKRLHSLLQSTYFRVRSVFDAGNNVSCPCCGGHFRTFLPFGMPIRPNAQCPRCGLLERHRLFWLYLKERTNFYKEKLKVLDVAPTRLFQKQCRKLPNIDYLSIDISSPLAMQKADITDLPFDDDSFDCIICYHVLEHVVDDRKAMRELHRVLRPGGWAVLQSPIDISREETYEDKSIITPRERERAFGQSDHVRIYGRDYIDRLNAAGFLVRADDFVMRYTPGEIVRYGLKPDEMIYFCRKENPSNC